jgi:hypothetical protein
LFLARNTFFEWRIFRLALRAILVFSRGGFPFFADYELWYQFHDQNKHKARDEKLLKKTLSLPTGEDSAYKANRDNEYDERL